MRKINGWNYIKKDANRVHFGLRVGLVTVYEFYFDYSDKDWRIVLLNFGVGK